MCGRDSAFYTWAEVHAFSQPLAFTAPAEDPPPRYNRAPSQPGWVLRAAADGAAEAVEMRWGLLPFWSRDGKPSYSTINARVESAAQKPAFREPWKRRRCLVPSSGYYEWKPLAGGRKQAYFIHAADGPLLMFAGLWDRWQGAEGEPRLSYSVLTRAAEGAVTAVHDRMPVCLPPECLRDWLQAPVERLAELVQALPTPELAFHPVAAAVGNVRNQGPSLIEPLAVAAPPAGADGTTGSIGPRSRMV